MITLFRPRAVAAQSSGEALDQRVRVVPLRASIALGLALLVLVTGAVWLFAGKVAITVSGSGTVVNAPTNVPVTAGVNGTVTGTQVPLGKHLAKGDLLSSVLVGEDQVVVPVVAPVSGTVVGLGIGEGASVSVGDYLATIAPDSSTKIAYLYVPEGSRGQIRKDMVVRLLPISADATIDGYLMGRVEQVSPLPVPPSRIAYVLADEALAQSLSQAGPLLEVMCSLAVDTSTPTGYAWSVPPGPAAPLVSGVPASGSIVLEQAAPYQAFFAG